MVDPSQLDPITYANDYAGSYVMDKKKRKMVYEDEIADADQDGMNDKWERDQGLHDPHTNRHKTLNVGNSKVLRMGRGGMIIEHDLLTSIKKPKGGFGLTIPDMKPIKLTMPGMKPIMMELKMPKHAMKTSVDIKSPNMKRVKIKTTMDDGKIKTPNFSIPDTFFKNHLKKTIDKYKKRRREKYA